MVPAPGGPGGLVLDQVLDQVLVGAEGCSLCVQALSVGIFPYVLKLLQSSARELRPLLVFIWAKILAVDSVSGGNTQTGTSAPRILPSETFRNMPVTTLGNSQEILRKGGWNSDWDLVLGWTWVLLGHFQVSLSLLS